MSPSLKYLMVSSIAARKSSSDPMSLTATLGVGWTCVLLVMCRLAPADRKWFGRAWTVSPSGGATGELDLPGRPDQRRIASRPPATVPGHGGTAPEHGAALRICRVKATGQSKRPTCALPPKPQWAASAQLRPVPSETLRGT